MEPAETRDSVAVEEELPFALPPMEERDVREVENILDYHFENQRLLEEALTHASYYDSRSRKKPGSCYERLEFIGDSVLNFLMTTELFFSYAELPPGQLTLLRALNVDNERLSRIAVSKALYPHLRHKIHELDQLIQVFVEEKEEYPIHSNGLVSAPKSLADIVESIIGAIYMDSNRSLEIVWRVFRRLAEPFVSLNDLRRHPVSELNELCQKNGMKAKHDMSTWDEDATVKYYVDGILFGSGTYALKKHIAQNRAAKDALINLKKTLMKESGLN